MNTPSDLVQDVSTSALLTESLHHNIDMMHPLSVSLLSTLFFLFHPVWTMVIVRSATGISCQSIPNTYQSTNPKVSLARRASTSIFQPSNTDTQPNGWTSHYLPGLPFDSADRSAADLRHFYQYLADEMQAHIKQGLVRGEELELIEGDQVGLVMQCYDNRNWGLTPIPDYQIVLDFLAYIVSLLYFEDTFCWLTRIRRLPGQKGDSLERTECCGSRRT